MDRLALTTRFLLFCLFFVAGAFAIVLSILVHPELYNYYHNRATLDELYARNDRIVELTDQYAHRIELIEAEPDILKRFSASTFGRKPEAPDTVFPQASNERLKSETEKILQTETKHDPIDPIPSWLQRIIIPANRSALFMAGTALVLIAFIFFGTPREKRSA